MNKYQERYEELKAKRLTSKQRWLCIPVFIFGWTAGLVIMAIGIGVGFRGLSEIISFFHDESSLYYIAAGLAFLPLSVFIFYCGVKLFKFGLKNFQMAVSGIRL
ncbi:hypothetical protein [Pleionea sediminis]|uniref:hypothetical protein n=1 Tax=Pleionea sediminis TaxID=2569479 RepID=UPI001184F313|nr:hypothetical protein [Pleionea sediminis]